MISEAYEYFGCNTSDLFVMSVNTGDTDAECIAFDQTYGIEFPCISGVEGGGTAINGTYGISAYPTYILIAPDHSIVEQDIWPVSSAQTFITLFESHGIMQAECGGTMTADFGSDVTEICQFNEVSFTDLSTGDITSWNWTFEGGDPATSTEQNPLVTYSETGTYDVELEVSDGTNSVNMLIEDYIEVLLVPPVMLQAFDDVCVDWPAFELTGGSPLGGTYEGPGVTNGWFDPSEAGTGTHTIVYTYTTAEGCFNSDEKTLYVDECVGIGEHADAGVLIYPNPARDHFMLKVGSADTYQVSVFSLTGVKVVEQEIGFSGSQAKQIDLPELENGLYFVSLKNNSRTIVQKITISGK